MKSSIRYRVQNKPLRMTNADVKHPIWDYLALLTVLLYIILYLWCKVSLPQPGGLSSCHQARWHGPPEASHAPRPAPGPADSPVGKESALHTHKHTGRNHTHRQKTHSVACSYHIYLSVGVPHVADDAAVLHPIQVLLPHHISVACRVTADVKQSVIDYGALAAQFLKMYSFTGTQINIS